MKELYHVRPSELLIVALVLMVLIFYFHEGIVAPIFGSIIIGLLLVSKKFRDSFDYTNIRSKKK